MANSVVVYGPQGSGKTLHGRAIAEKHGLIQVIDLEDVQLMGERLQRQGFLYLSCSDRYAGRAAKVLGTSVIHIDQTLVSIGVDGGGRMAELLVLLLAPAAGGTLLYRLWVSRPAPRRHSGLAVGQIPQRERRRRVMAVRRAGGSA